MRANILAAQLGHHDFTIRGAGYVLDTDPDTVLSFPPAAVTASAAADALDASMAAVEALIDATARAKGYSGAASLASYATSTVTAWAAEAAAFVAWRDDVWTAVYDIRADVEAGNRPAPSIEALLAELPAITWPA